MRKPITPCIWYDGNAKDSASFYCSLFKNSKIIIETPMVIILELNGNKIMHLNGGPKFKINPSISFFVTSPSIQESNELWEKLIEGGKALMPIDKYDWSERYGWLQDKYGMTWQISLADNKNEKQKITSSLLFANDQFGKAEQAINFYSSIFKESSIDLLLKYPLESPNGGKVMYSEFRLNNNNFIAMDGPGVHDYTFNEGVSFMVSCSTQEEIDYYWHKLTEGGQESMCGWLKDQFGVSWQIVPEIIGKLMSDPSKAGRVMNAVLQMKKLDIEKMITA